ncbi:unnamed protein product [Darwinula stevensoni]|uniref:Cytochrome P450 2U1 n=1 Tax=Darwinula stevensoni TaxID=69355 RepID=A0A7R9FS51_9CRUS|nr:unnamed protein product [Darwinula stevensoni]CAG0902836.1 unnamed protein product [Darwinula stevensoni]
MAMGVTLIFIYIILVYLLHFFVKKFRIWSKLPPGPWGEPILLIDGCQPSTLDAPRKKHGDVYNFSTIIKDVVVLCGWESVRDVFGRAEFSGRPDLTAFRQVSFRDKGLAASSGSLWQENRRFTMRVLKDFGLGKKAALDSVIQDAAVDLCQFLIENRHEPQDLGPRLNLAILNIIWKMTADKQFSHNDAKMQDFMNRIMEVFGDFDVVRHLQFSPLLASIWPPTLLASRRIARNMAAIFQLFADEVEEHKRKLPLSGGSNDYIDAYLTEMAQQKARGEVNPNFSGIVRNLEIVEGMEERIGSSSMPYTEAFIMETHRLVCLFPYPLPHESLEEAEVVGYRFPKGTSFLANLWSCHMDPKFWPDPEKFDPGRFLNPDGSVKTKVPSFLPFSLGPWGVPLLGSAPFLDGGQPYALDALRKKYGDIYTLGVLSKDLVILGNWELIREIFGRAEFSGRTEVAVSRQIFFGKNAIAGHKIRISGIAFSSGSLWQENRRFTIRVLKDFGFGKKAAMDSMIQDAAVDLCKFLIENRQEPQDLGPRLNLAILNIIWKMTAGSRTNKQFSHDDAKMQDFMNRIMGVFMDSDILRHLQWTPLLAFLWPPSFLASRRIARNMAAIRKTFSRENNIQALFPKNEVEEHKRKLPLAGGSNDYIDAYLTEMAQQKARGEVNPNFSEFQLEANISDLFIAGSETTSNTIRWCVLFLLCHPEIQEKLQAEVDNVVGRDRLPSLDDRHRMPYTEAFIMETHRLASLVPYALPHEAIEDAEVAGFLIPKGTTFLANVWSCHMDPNFWPDPEKFDPGRFLNPDGSVKTKVPSFLPFSLGKRQCLGESLAQMELFLFVTIFMQKLTFRTTTGRPYPKADGSRNTLINQPKPFVFLVEERNH